MRMGLAVAIALSGVGFCRGEKPVKSASERREIVPPLLARPEYLRSVGVSPGSEPPQPGQRSRIAWADTEETLSAIFKDAFAGLKAGILKEGGNPPSQGLALS
jgi:hypothetical protein